MKQKTKDETDMEFIQTLTDEQSCFILNNLLRSNPSLIPQAAAIARNLLSGTDEEEVSENVRSELSFLDVHQLWHESGNTAYGYVDPYEHSYEMMEEIIEPYLDEMNRYQDRGMITEALEYCRGIIKGICLYMYEDSGEFGDWAVDNEDGLSYDVIDRWKMKNNDTAILRELESFRLDCLKYNETFIQ